MLGQVLVLMALLFLCCLLVWNKKPGMRKMKEYILKLSEGPGL